ncbi:MAG TPA: hemin uptake protein HemP [Gemmataceae bacterium]|nr:hemin uptake protein HemP [Gemmataceae bacterium]
MSKNEGRQPKEMRQPDAALPLAILRAEELFRGQREICIEHNGEHYRLRITRRNKLILQK